MQQLASYSSDEEIERSIGTEEVSILRFSIIEYIYQHLLRQFGNETLAFIIMIKK